MGATNATSSRFKFNPSSPFFAQDRLVLRFRRFIAGNIVVLTAWRGFAAVVDSFQRSGTLATILVAFGVRVGCGAGVFHAFLRRLPLLGLAISPR